MENSPWQKRTNVRKEVSTYFWPCNDEVGFLEVVNVQLQCSFKYFPAIILMQLVVFSIRASLSYIQYVTYTGLYIWTFKAELVICHKFITPDSLAELWLACTTMAHSMRQKVKQCLNGVCFGDASVQRKTERMRYDNPKVCLKQTKAKHATSWVTVCDVS